MAEPKYPMSKEEVVEFLARGRAELEAVLDSLTDEQLTRPGPDGWAVTDHMVHLALWEAGIAALLGKADRWATMGLARDVVEANDEDTLNQIIQGQHAALSLDEVRALFAQAHRDLLAAIEPLTYEDLMRPYKYYDPESNSENPVGFYVAGNTWGHWEDHIRWIRALAGVE